MNRILNFSPVKLFRFLIVLEIILIVFGVAASMVGEQHLPDELRNFVEGQDLTFEESPFYSISLLVIGVLLFLFGIITPVLLWNFKRLGLLLFLISFLFFPLSFLFGIDIVTPVEQVIMEFCITIPGVMFGLVFHPELRLKFEV